jgi:hypothetical protein
LNQEKVYKLFAHIKGEYFSFFIRKEERIEDSKEKQTKIEKNGELP